MAVVHAPAAHHLSDKLSFIPETFQRVPRSATTRAEKKLRGMSATKKQALSKAAQCVAHANNPSQSKG